MTESKSGTEAKWTGIRRLSMLRELRVNDANIRYVQDPITKLIMKSRQLELRELLTNRL